MASRYSSRYDADRRSRSPRDRSPDRYERASQYSDGDRRRSSAEARSNTGAFQNNRDSFRDNLPREPPRGPKALIDPPSGPRGGGYAGEFNRGRGRGRGGRGWSREDSRDRGRDRDIDFRDRRDPPYRDERSRERERDRDWRDREGYRGRPRSPAGRGRSPPQRDFRDRDPPLGVDAERSRRGSRDGGPPSAGSSNSDPPYAMARGGFRGGRERGRGGWADRGRGRGGFYEDRDREQRFGPRSRSQEGRWGGRDRDDRDRGDRWIDSDARRDPRDDRDPRDRELLRPKVDRDRDRGASSQAPSPNTKDISPPPLAPSAPAFGTVPSRNVGAADGSPVIGGTGKLPPTAPRAFNAERPVSAGHSGGSDFPNPPTGPAKPNLPDGSSLIPSGPRAQQQKQQRPSSKQWINPALAGKKIPESPKMMRSQSFAQQQRPVPFRHESVPADQGDYDRRPRSSDAKADSHASTTEGSVKSLNLPEPGEIIIKSERDSYSARASMDRDAEHMNASRDTVMGGTDAYIHDEYRSPSRGEEKTALSDRPSLEEGEVDRNEELVKPAKQSRTLASNYVYFLPSQEPSAPVSEQTSESDDDEDYGEYFRNEIAKEEALLHKLQDAADSAPDRVAARYAKVSHDAMAAIVMESEGLVDMLGPVPEVVEHPKEKTPVEQPVVEQREKTPNVPSPVLQTKTSPKTKKRSPTPPPKAPEPALQAIPEVIKEAKTEKAVEVTAEKTTERTVEKAVEKASEKVSEKTPEKKEKAAAKSAQKVAEEPTEKSSDGPTEKPVEKPEEPRKTVDRVMEKPTEAATQQALEPEAKKADEPIMAPSVPEPQPKTEEMDVDEPVPIITAPPIEASDQVKDTDVAMEDAAEPDKAATESIAADHEEEPKELVTNGQALLLQPPGVPIETIEGDKALPSTPSQMEDDEDDNSTESEDTDAMMVDSIRQFSATPPIDSLPDYGCRPWHRDRDFLQTLDSDPMIDSFIMEHLDKISGEKKARQEDLREDYAENYIQYLEFTVSDDPIAIKSRETFISCLPTREKHIPVPPPPELKPEGRGAGRRYASERDLERVLQASMREDEERKEREQRAMQERYRSDKEAVIPAMFWTQEDRDAEYFKDVTGFTPVEKLVPAWQILPPVNNFTPEEAELFEKRYLTNPKQWGVVAENVPKRNFGTCIQYYYLMKKELNLKEKLKKQPKRRKKGRGKTRSSALVSELGNAENEGEENQENGGENGERRRPRRAAAPTWGFEQPPTDSENATPTGTPGRRGAKADPDKPDGRKRGRRAAKEKEPKAAKPQQTLAAAPTPASGKGRSRSNSRVQNPEFQPPPVVPMENRLPSQFEVATSGVQPSFPTAQAPLAVQERPVPIPPSAISEVMAPPSLRPEPPPLPAQPTLATFDIAQPQQPERRPPSTASSYWSVSEANDFPGLLKSFGQDWAAIAAHMGSKTAVMVKNYFVRQRDQGKTEWEQLVADAEDKKSRGEKLPDPPPPTVGGRKKYDSTPGGSHRPLASAPAAPVATATPPATPAAPITAEPPSEVVTPKIEPAAPPNPQFGRFPMPITPAPPVQPPQQQQPLAQAPPPAATATQVPPTQVPQPAPVAVQPQHVAAQPVITPSGSPVTRPVRAPQQPTFGFQERERESTQPPQPLRISQKPSATPVPEPVQQQRPLAAAQPAQASQPEPQIDRQLERQQQQDLARQMERQRMEERQRIEERQRMEERQMREERQRMEAQRMEAQRMEAQRMEAQRMEQQRADQLRIEQQQREQQQRMEAQRIEQQQREQQQREQQRMEHQQRLEQQQQQQQQMERDRHQMQLERQQQAERAERQKMEQPKEQLRPTERTRLKQEPEMATHHPYEPFSFAPQPVRSVPRSEPPPVAPRQPAEPPRGAPTPAPQGYGQPMPQPGPRGLLGDPQPPVSTPPGQRPIAAQRPMPTHMDSYPTPPQPAQPPPAAATPGRPPASERKKSNLMALLNDDPPAAAAAPVTTPQAKRVSDMAQAKPSPTPPPQAVSRGPAPPPAPTPLRPEREPPQGYPYSHTRNAPSASAMPPLKPTYTASPQAQHMSAPRSSMTSPHDAAAAVERDYYRHQYPHQPGATSSPQVAQPYPPQAQPPRDPYQPQPQPGYPSYGAPSAHAGSPPQQYAVHQPGSRREPPPPQGRETAWPSGPQGHPMGQPQQPQQPQSAWPPSHAPPPKQSQPPPAQSNWASPHVSAQKIPQAGGPMQQQSWASAPPPQQQQQQPLPHHHMPMRDERGASMYAMQGRYPPPASRAPEPLPPQAPAYPTRYATPAPRDPRDQMPPRMHTPGVYDARGPPPGAYAPDPREMQLREMGRDPRDPRDPRELQQQAMLQRQLRPHEGYERQPDRYGR